MDELTIRGGRLTLSSQMNLGRIVPGKAEVVALVDAIRTNAEERAVSIASDESRSHFLETYIPLSLNNFYKITADFAGAVEELAEEDERQHREHQRMLMALEDLDLDREERELARKERAQKERAQRFEESQVETDEERDIARDRQQLFEERERLTSRREMISDNRFYINQPIFRPKHPVPGLRSFISSMYGRAYKPTLEEYQDYLRSFNEGYAEAVDSLARDTDFPEAMRDQHSLVVAPTGWGKSELLKQLIYHYVHHGSAGVLILDPLGDLAKQVGRWPELVDTDRLVVVDPLAERGFTVGLNPFDGRDIRDEEHRKDLASEWSYIIGEITGDITMGMRRVANNCIRVLLGWHKQATLMDLKYLLGDPEQIPKNSKTSPLDGFGAGQKMDPLALARMQRKGELQDFARNYPDAELQEFFRTEFNTLSVSSTRQALRARLDLLLQIPFAEALLVGKQTLDLRSALDQRKVVIVNLLPFGSTDNIKTIGCMFLGMIAAMGRKRGEIDYNDRVPVQVVVDEATMIVSPILTKLLTQMRKFRVHVTLAQQIDGDGFTHEQRRAMIACTRCKLVAPANRDAVELLGMYERTTLEPLYPRQFYVRWGDEAEPVRVAVDGTLADRLHEVGPEAFQAHLNRGKAAGLYRPAYAAPAVGVELPTLPAPEPDPDDAPATSSAEAPPAGPPATIRKPLKRPLKAAKPGSKRTTTTGKPKLFPDPSAGAE